MKRVSRRALWRVLVVVVFRQTANLVALAFAHGDLSKRSFFHTSQRVHVYLRRPPEDRLAVEVLALTKHA